MKKIFPILFVVFFIGGCGDDEDETTDVENAYTLFNCPESASTIDDFTAYRNPDFAVGLVDKIIGIARSYVDESQNSPCGTNTKSYSCIEGHYTTTNGITVDYEYTENILANGSGLYDYSYIVLNETVHVVLPEGMKSWSELDVSSENSRTSSWDGVANSLQLQASWKGSLDPSWPSDYSLEASYASGMDDGGCEYSSSSLTHDVCSLTNKTRIGAVAGIEITVNNHKLETEHRSDSEWDCYINGHCVGQIDLVAWEIIGECEQE